VYCCSQTISQHVGRNKDGERHYPQGQRGGVSEFFFFAINTVLYQRGE